LTVPGEDRDIERPRQSKNQKENRQRDVKASMSACIRCLYSSDQ
jgi:hypothetical protein